MFQHRHYTFIARTIANLGVNEQTREIVAADFANALRGTNPNYDRSRFMSAALGRPENGRDK
jgi:hypothetical protein